jgi:hypothetical protein
MNLPIQSQPVMRNVSTAAFSGGNGTIGSRLYTYLFWMQ